MRARVFMLLAIVLAGCSAPAVAPRGTSVDPSSIATVRLVIHRSATCSCCHLHLAYLRDAGWQVDDVSDADNTATKDRMGIPADARSCHTTIAAR